MAADQFRLRQTWKRIRKSEQGGDSAGTQLDRFWEQLRKSLDRCRQRFQLRPAVRFDNELPITEKRDEIRQAIEQNPVVIVCGETGSGKSTQIPKICLDMGRGVAGMIGHTQPRRIAARSVAARLADELGSQVGASVGFKIRFSDATGPLTYVKVMTDGILLAETQGDRFLELYDTIIVDEAHERSLNIDFLLGYLLRLIPKRPDFRVIVTSATIDAERFSQHFAFGSRPAPVVQVSGRTYPVEVWYRPPESAEDDDEPDRHQAVLDAIDEVLHHDRAGDMLVFLATEREIHEVSKSLRGRLLRSPNPCEVFPLYARLSATEQNKVFQSHSRRRIILATNVAESSLTVPGIRYVIDTGVARVNRYSPRSRMQRLPIEPISQASANQRQGRCGRVGPGICVRLYSVEDFEGRDRYATPEIRRSNLAAVILQSEALRLGPINEFPFLDPPQPQLVHDGYTTLHELGAVDDRGDLTEIGKRLSRLPVDPRIGRMILASLEEGCLSEILIIASALEVQDPRERPIDKQAAADTAHQQFNDSDSDFLTYLNIWTFYHDLKDKLSANQLRKACHQNFLSYLRMREWCDVHRQLQRQLHEVEDGGWRKSDPKPQRGERGAPGLTASGLTASGLKTSPATAALQARAGREREHWYGRIHRSLLAGLLSGIAFRKEESEYQAAGNLKVILWPGSGLAVSKPKWIVAAELVETTRRYARCVARISPDWLEPLARHLVNRSYSDPHWQAKSGNVVAYEKVTLFGLTISSGRIIPYGPIDPETARELFIRHALVQQELRTEAPFFRNNRDVRAETEQLMAKTRRTDLCVDDFAIHAFYARRLPPDIYDSGSLERWRRIAEQENPKVLFMLPTDMTSATELPESDAFPDQYPLESSHLDLEYRFEPGAQSDGLTIIVPAAAARQISEARLGWLVPGLLEQKLLAMVRALPKSLRRNLGQASDVVKMVMDKLTFGSGDLTEQVASILSRIAGETISVANWEGDRLPAHLRMNVRLVDDDGKTIHEGRELSEIRNRLGPATIASSPQLSTSQWYRDGITRWDFGDLPEFVEQQHGRVTVQFFPALIDQGDKVSLRLVESQESAKQVSRGGLRRLFYLREQRSLKSHLEWIPNFNQTCLHAATLLPAADLRRDVMLLVADQAFLGFEFSIRSSDDFEIALRLGRDRIDAAVAEVTRLIGPLFKNYHGVRLLLDSKSSALQAALDDMKQQLSQLLAPGFLLTTPWSSLRHFPRYLEAMQFRHKKLVGGGIARDRQLSREIESWTRAFEQRAQEHQRRGLHDPQLAAFRWMLEEYRVSIFAQQLGTEYPVSEKRLQKQWESVQK